MNSFLKFSKINNFFLIIILPIILLVGGIFYISVRRIHFNPIPNYTLLVSGFTGDFDENAGKAIFNNQPVDYKMSKINPHLENLELQEGIVLGSTNNERWIEVDLSEQKLYAKEGEKIVYEFLVSTGKWIPTPTGEFRIWAKLRYTKMEGGKKGTNTYYYLPNVPYTQYFYKDFGIHGTYWHNNFGYPMSHGCINMKIVDAEKLFYWTSPPVIQGKNIAYSTREIPGTRVVIHE